jgi:Icc-related predicted phosphoesterase
VDAVVACGDLPFDYLEYIVTVLNVPLLYVLGNHDPETGAVMQEGKVQQPPGGCTPLDGRIESVNGVTFAGLSGSMLYSGGPNQHSENAMRLRSWQLSAKIAARRALGRPVPDVFVTHSPPLGLGDREDLCHTGFGSFVDLIDRHRPELWLHGHVHLYGAEPEREQKRGKTRILNVFGYQIVEV